jgi:hypothetical protein
VNDDLSYSLYFGLDDAEGASQEDSPTRFSFGDTDRNGNRIVSDENVSILTNNLNGSTRIRQKYHGELKYKNWDNWVRYTRGGIEEPLYQYHFFPADWNLPQEEYLESYLIYNQLTLNSQYEQDFGNLQFEGKLGYDVSEYEHLLGDVFNEISQNYRENEIYSRLLLKYNTESISLAMGPSMSYETFGLPLFGDDEEVMRITSKIQGSTLHIDSLHDYSVPWNTLMLSFTSEAQYYHKDLNLKLLAGMRVDKHSYTGFMYSPRASLIWGTDIQNQVRLSYSRSNRRASDADLRAEYLRQGKEEAENVESVNFYELSGSKSFFENVTLVPTLFYGDMDMIAWKKLLYASVPIGTFTYWGTELKLQYRTDKAYGFIAHSYFRPIELDLVDYDEEKPTNNISTMPYGYGENMHNHPDNLLKIYLRYSVMPKLSLNSALQVSGRMYGAEDAARYNKNVLGNRNNDVRTDGSTIPFEPSYYLQLGARYKIGKHFSAQLQGHNLLGLFDENWNKRQSFQRVSHYRIQPVAVSLRLKMQM